jgi:hypothetical protein
VVSSKGTGITVVGVSPDVEEGVFGRLAIQQCLQFIWENQSQEKNKTEKGKG